MGRIEVGRMDNPFVITSVCRTDVIQAFEEKGKTKAREIARCLTDDEMTWVARKMSDDYCNQLFWQSLRIRVEAIIERRSIGMNCPKCGKVMEERKKISRNSFWVCKPCKLSVDILYAIVDDGGW